MEKHWFQWRTHTSYISTDMHVKWRSFNDDYDSNYSNPSCMGLFNQVIRYISHVFLCLNFASKKLTILILIYIETCSSMGSVNTTLQNMALKVKQKNLPIFAKMTLTLLSGTVSVYSNFLANWHSQLLHLLPSSWLLQEFLPRISVMIEFIYSTWLRILKHTFPLIEHHCFFYINHKGNW